MGKRRKRRFTEQGDAVLKAREEGQRVKGQLLVEPLPDELEAFRCMTAEEVLGELDRRLRVAVRLGYVERRTGADGETEFRVLDRMW